MCGQITPDGQGIQESSRGRERILLLIIEGLLLFFLILILWPTRGWSTQAAAPAAPVGYSLAVSVTDETNLPVESAQLTLTQNSTRQVFKSETNYSGQAQFSNLPPGQYQLEATKEGFYVLTVKSVQVGTTQKVDLILNHQQELHQTMNVEYSPPAIDPTQTVQSEGLTGQEIVDLPYPTTRDIRQALPLIPGVLPDASGQIHVDGSATNQTLDQLDGFNITDPVTGLFNLRVSADAVRSIDLESNRYSAEFGKASGGILNLATGMGDDRFRFSATNFVPSIQNKNGLKFNSWTPRAVFSGPLIKGKAWFFDSPDAEYDNHIVTGLPGGADQNRTLRWSNLLKTQINLSPGNVLTASLLLNHFHSPYAGLSVLAPQETTLNQTETAYLATVKDQAYFSSGALLEVGMAVSQFHTSDFPQGSLPFVFHPEGVSGNNNRTDDGTSRRYQWLVGLNLPPVNWHGKHEFKIGTDLDDLTYRQSIRRAPISILREDGTLSRQITFSGPPSFSQNNFEVGTYLVDRWTLSSRSLVEWGLRQDWDQVLGHVTVSLRLAGSYVVTSDGRTKLSAGVGLYYDATHLDFITRPLQGERMDVSYAADGVTPLGPPVLTSFTVDTRNLREPRFLNWSVGLERELPKSFYLSVNYIQKRGRNGFAFANAASAATAQPAGQFELTNMGRDRFDAVEVDVRHTFWKEFPFLWSYTRAAARSNAVIDFTLDNPVFSPQAGGPLPWDSPNRFLTWGGAPLWKGLRLFYVFDWRDGYPFNVVDQNQQLVGNPGSRRFPAFFSLDLHMEKRFSFLGYQLALRAGFNNITNRQNASTIVNNISSPQFLTLEDVQGRVFTARIRFLGRN